MQVLRKVLPVIVILALLYGGVLVVERMTRQELTRAVEAGSQEAACIMWQPRLLRGDGVVSVALLNADGRQVDEVVLGPQATGYEALQQYGQVGFENGVVTVTNLRSGELMQRLVVQDGRLSKAGE